MTLLTNVSICSSTALILSSFIVSFQQSIFTPSFRPRLYSAHLAHRKFVSISEFFIGEASTRIGIDFCSPRFDFLILRPGECLVPVYDRFGRQNISTAYRQNLLTKPIDSILVNEFIPSLSRITALDWDISLPSYSCLCFNDVFSRTDLSSLQRLYIEVDHFTKPFLGSKHWPLINDMPSVFFLDCKLSISECMECHHMHYEWLGRVEIFEAVCSCLRSRRFPLEDDGKSGAIQALGHDNTCALLEIFTWEGSLRLQQHQTDALKRSYWWWSSY